MTSGEPREGAASATGAIEAVFAPRFELPRRIGARLLADLGPKGGEAGATWAPASKSAA